MAARAADRVRAQPLRYHCHDRLLRLDPSVSAPPPRLSRATCSRFVTIGAATGDQPGTTDRWVTNSARPGPVPAPVRARSSWEPSHLRAAFELAPGCQTGTPQHRPRAGADVPAQVTGSSSEASTTVAKSVATVTGTFTTSSAALLLAGADDRHVDARSARAVRRETEAASECMRVHEGESIDLGHGLRSPALTRTFVVMDGPSEKRQATQRIVTVEPSATAFGGQGQADETCLVRRRGRPRPEDGPPSPNAHPGRH